VSGMRRTPRTLKLKEANIACMECFPHAGAGFAYNGPIDYYRINRNRGWRPGNDATLPPAGNGHPAPTGECETCMGIGIVAVPL
jgi:hypothetical protein